MTNQTVKNVLICTVGGSHQPIVSAVNATRPDFVGFICTGKDPATGQPGSEVQITGKGSCIKAHPADSKPSLPNIPAQTNLTDEQYQLILTPSDNLDQTYQDCVTAITALQQRFPEARLIADYTGGTKSMTAALVMAALEFPAVELMLVTGNRADLIRVHDGSQYSALANSEQIRFQRLLAPYKQSWNRYAYSEAAAGVKTLQPPQHHLLRAQYTRFHDLSIAFAEWDNFNHAQAQQHLHPYAPILPKNLKAYISVMQRLSDNDPAKATAARLLDLYLNAQRRAAQGRYDDAIARLYRLLEWTAQWLLETQCRIKTGDLHPEQLPDGFSLKPNRDGKLQAGLREAWQLVKLKTGGAAAEFISAQENVMLNHLKIRNSSILAHGFEPVYAVQWQPMAEWLETQFLPMLLAEAAKVGIKAMPPQLPDHYPEPVAAFERQ